MKKLYLWLGCFVVAACNQPAQNTINKADSTNRSTSPVSTTAPPAIPLYRESVKKTPVAEFKERTSNPLNEWYFSVKLYETPKTFYYLMKLQYEEVEGEDTLKLPNFGKAPEPVIEKGPEKYSCIVGFKDKGNNFKEYKKVYVDHDHLKVTALRHYTVAAYTK